MSFNDLDSGIIRSDSKPIYEIGQKFGAMGGSPSGVLEFLINITEKKESVITQMIIEELTTADVWYSAATLLYGILTKRRTIDHYAEVRINNRSRRIHGVGINDVKTRGLYNNPLTDTTNTRMFIDSISSGRQLIDIYVGQLIHMNNSLVRGKLRAIFANEYGIAFIYEDDYIPLLTRHKSFLNNESKVFCDIDVHGTSLTLLEHNVKHNFTRFQQDLDQVLKTLST